jgi:DNA invertase Pin-like site-specific DNA recombinase
MTAAIYVRVSSDSQNHDSQEPDLTRWAGNYDGEVLWFTDKASGASMNRPGWLALEQAIRSGKIDTLVCWKLDRLGRTACELLKLRDELQTRKVDLVCVMSGVMGLDSAEGRMMFSVIASFAEYEREIRRDRQRAGIDAAKRKGKYRGRKPGTLKAKPRRAATLRKRGLTGAEIAEAMGVSRMTVQRYLKMYPE